jgi:cystathionine gamma-lyase
MSVGEPLGDGTRCVHAGQPAAEPGAPFLPGPTFAAPYHLSHGEPAGEVPAGGVPAGEVPAGEVPAGEVPAGEVPAGAGSAGAVTAGDRRGPDTYGREDNPTWRRYEAAIGELEGGDAIAFASGMAAATAVLLTTVRSGDTVVLPADGYYSVRALAAERLVPLGVTVRLLPTAAPVSAADLAGAALLLLETPSNPRLDVVDIAAAVEVAHRQRVPVAVDNTTATPLGQRPLQLGADYSLASDTKAVTGHSDLVLGHVTAWDPDRVAALRRWRTLTGAIPGPFEVWLAHRSLGTLDLRLARQAQNAAALAAVLAGHQEIVTAVRYPGLPTDPAYPVAARQMRRFGGVLAFTLPSSAAVAAFLRAARLVGDATSFGGLHTTADRRARWGGDVVPPGFVRLSAGCEDTADLVADVDAALITVAKG